LYYSVQVFKREEESLGTVRFVLLFIKMMILISILYFLFFFGFSQISNGFNNESLPGIVTMALCCIGMYAGRDPDGESRWCCWPCRKKEKAVLDCLIWCLLCGEFLALIIATYVGY